MEEKQITLQIDGHFITVPEGSTILEAACKIGINIPNAVSHRPERNLYQEQPRFLPHLCSRSGRTPQSGSRLRYPLHRRDGSENQYPARDERPESR